LDISRIYFSADENYLSAAADELRPYFPDSFMEPVGPDLGAFEEEGVSIALMARTIRENHLVFPRHLMRGVGMVELEEARDLAGLGDIALGFWEQFLLPAEVSLHVWQSGQVEGPYRTDQLWRRLASALTDMDIEVKRGGAAHILSACVTGQGIIFGSNGAANALTDWPGGRVRLAKPKGQISRAEFKLEELFRTDAVTLPDGGTALDLGASPGGWSRILLERGFEVWAVDPGDLDTHLSNRQGLHHVKTTAGPFLAENRERFDLVVNDMRMAPVLSASVMNSAAGHLVPHGLGIMTVKLQPTNPPHVVDETFRMLSRAWEIVFARQLHHNRNEITVVIRPKPAPPR
jgi:23S rRNA (cytidine2498-2'-O)-methyltransferase